MSDQHSAIIGGIFGVIAIACVAHTLAMCVVSAVLLGREYKRKKDNEKPKAWTVTYHKDSGETIVYIIEL